MEALSRGLLLSIENNRKGIAMVTHLIDKKNCKAAFHHNVAAGGRRVCSGEKRKHKHRMIVLYRYIQVDLHVLVRYTTVN